MPALESIGCSLGLKHYLGNTLSSIWGKISGAHISGSASAGNAHILGSAGL